MMEDTNEACTHYRESFPSTEFLYKYFGESVTIKGNPHRAEIDHDLYTWLRRLFDGVLRGAPKHILRSQNNLGQVHVFENGVPAPWVDPELERRGLMLELTPEAFLELSQEFIRHYQAGAFKGSDWWQWRTEGNSIWIENVVGVVRKRRTLADLLGKT